MAGDRYFAPLEPSLWAAVLADTKMPKGGWPESWAIADLRVYYASNRRPMPRREAQERWGWEEWATRKLLEDLPRWMHAEQLKHWRGLPRSSQNSPASTRK